MPGRGYVFPRAPDGQAGYATPDGGWILATNSEIAGGERRRVGDPLRRRRDIIDSYRILGGTSANCAGGPTPWGTWLSCEEVDSGQVWECDPTGNTAAVARPLLGWFKHEACCVDPVRRARLPQRGLRRRLLLPLRAGRLSGSLGRHAPGRVPRRRPGHGRVEAGARPEPRAPRPGDPVALTDPDALKYRRGEGMWFDSGLVYLVTTADHTIHVYDTATGGLSMLYEAASVPGTPLTDPDNIHVSAALGRRVRGRGQRRRRPARRLHHRPRRAIDRFLKVTGTDHGGSEVIGLTFNPAGRGSTSDRSAPPASASSTRSAARSARTPRRRPRRRRPHPRRRLPLPARAHDRAPGLDLDADPPRAGDRAHARQGLDGAVPPAARGSPSRASGRW